MKSKSGLYFTPFLLVIQLTGCRDQRDISRPLSVVAHKQNEKVEPAQRTEKSVTRREFAKQMAKVKRGMSETEVLALLGEPDDRLIGREQTRVAIALGKQIWCYGTNGHFTFPTLGWIYFDADGKADYIFGGQGNPPEPTLLPEQELREILRILDLGPQVYSSGYNPLDLIKIVNQLVPLGKEKALAAIEEYLRIGSFDLNEEERIFLVLRVLFEIPTDLEYQKNPMYSPECLLGALFPPEPEDPKLMPRFPILVLDDIPLLVADNSQKSGLPAPVSRHLDYLHRLGQLRDRRLFPTNQPLSIPDHYPPALRKYFLKWVSSEWPGRQEDQIKEQLLRLVTSVYHKKRKLSVEQALEEAAKLQFRWDSAQQKYAFMDGSVLSDLPVYPQLTWTPQAFGIDVTLTIDREDEEFIEIGIEEGWRTCCTTNLPSLRIYSLKEKDKPLAEFENVCAHPLWRGTRNVPLAVGEPVQGKLFMGKEEVLSPIFRP